MFASSFPDGLEWSIERITGSTEVESAGGVYDLFASIQEKTSFLPDYALKSTDSAVGTTISGIVGAAIVLGLCVAASYAFKFFRNEKEKQVTNE